ncbi:hypothetical protein BDZ97DRAFT_1902163 [Flammula alnicola]|nr:hypothetical protein BDZ97DRAFT_1902163 [Flammula alnicola]
MKFTAGFISLLAAAQSVVAIPFGSSGPVNDLAPVPVTKLVCDGDTFKCTGNLDFGDGRWVAQWGTAVFHTGLFGQPDHKAMSEMAMAPVPVTKLVCDGDSFLCTANLDFGDGRWVAQWSTNVFHQGMFASGATGSMAPVPVTNLACDGDSFKCTANLNFGDGRWVAQWSTSVFHTGAFLDQN